MICEAFRRFGPESPFDDPFGHVRATAISFPGHTTRSSPPPLGQGVDTVPPPIADLERPARSSSDQDDRLGRREYRSPDGTWRVVRTRRPGGNRNERPRWEVHERPEAHAPWHCHAAFERRRDALVFLDTTTVTPGGESPAAAAATSKRREPSQPRKPRRRITHDIDETRSEENIRWSLCGVLLYDEKQIAHGDEPSTCGKCQRYTTATSYLKRREAMKAAKKKKPGRTPKQR